MIIIIKLEEQFKSLKLGSLSTYVYCQAIQTAADNLANAGRPVSDEQLVLQTLHGLPEQYETFANFISSQNPFPTFTQLRSLVLMEEARLNANIFEEFCEKLQRKGKEPMNFRE